MRSRLLLNPDAQGGAGADATTTTAAATTTTSASEARGQGQGQGHGGLSPEVLQALNGLLSKHNGDASAVATLLFTENKQYRDTIRDLKAKIPADGSVVLAGDDLAAWNDFRKLGIKPADITAAIAERDTFKAESEAARHAELVRTAAELAGFKPTVLATLVKAHGTELAVSDPDARGVRTVSVKDGDKTVPLAEYAQAKWADHLPALKAEQGRPLGTPPGRTAQPNPSATARTTLPTLPRI